MKGWQFFLAIALLLLLLFPMYEGVTDSYPFQLSSEQTKIMGRAPFKPEDEDEIIQLITQSQMNQIPEIKKDNFLKLYKITTATPEVIHKLTTKEINDLTRPQFEALLRRLTKLNVGLRPEQLNGMSQPGLYMLSDKLKSATYNLNSF